MRSPWLSLLLALLSGSGALGAALTGCDEVSTSGHRVTLATRLEAQDAGAPFTTGLGWTITLTRAAVATGGFYYFDGPAPFALAPSPRRRRWASLLGPSLAWAHPGHYAPGNARGQELSPWSADLLAGPTELPPGDGITGTVRSARFTLAAASTGPGAAQLSGQAAMAAGSAEKDGTTVHFSVAASFDDIRARASDGHIEGCVFEEVDIEADGTVTARVLPSVWFGLVDFKNLAPGSADDPTVITPDDDAHLAFVVGVAQLSAYRFSYAP